MSDLTRAFRRATINTMDNRGRSGVLGRGDGTVQFTDSNGTDHRNLVWVRIITDAAVTTVVAQNTGVPLQPNLPVRVADVNGVPTILGTDTKKSNIYTGGYIASVAEHAWSHGRFGPDPVYITGAQFIPLMAIPSNPAAMTVTVQEGWYRWKYVEKVWTEADSASLSAYVPATQGTQHFIVLSLDRSTNTLAITDGIDKNTPLLTAVPFTTAEVLAIVATLDTAYYPIAAIRFYYGQTTIKAPDIFKDLRLWAGEVRLEADLIVTDGDGNIVVDGSGNVVIEA